jgi:uncharacterized membrane protein
MVIAFPFLLCLTFASDLAFYATSNEFWATASFWLLGIGLITAALAAATGLIDAFGEWQDSRPVDTRVHAVSNAIALLIALYNSTRDSSTAAPPWCRPVWSFRN